MDTLQNALKAVEDELAVSEPQLAALTKRVAALRQTQSGLRSVLDMDATPPPTSVADDKRLMKAAASNLASLDNLIDTLGTVVGTGGVGSSGGENFARPNTTDGVRAILKEHADTTMRLDDVRAEFKARGWVDPDWARPDATIYAAIVRLSDSDPHVIREGKKWWKYVTTPVAVNGADNASEVFTS